MDLYESIEQLKELVNDLNEINANEGYLLQDGIKFDTIQAIETVLKVHQDLQEEFFLQQIRIRNEYVKKDKIREKIVEYKNLLMCCNRFSDVDRIKSINERILAYEELLKESN